MRRAAPTSALLTLVPVSLAAPGAGDGVRIHASARYCGWVCQLTPARQHRNRSSLNLKAGWLASLRREHASAAPGERESWKADPVGVFKFIVREKPEYRVRLLWRTVEASALGSYARRSRPHAGARRATTDCASSVVIHDRSRGTKGVPRILAVLGYHHSVRSSRRARVRPRANARHPGK